MLLLVTVPARLVGAVGETSSEPGGGGSFSRGAVHGAAGPGSTPAPISKMVPSTSAAGTAPFHRMRDSAPRARVTSAACSPVYVAVQLVPFGFFTASIGSNASVPSEPAAEVARRVRRPFSRKASLLATMRCSSWAASIGLPAAVAAVPWICTVLGLSCTGR